MTENVRDEDQGKAERRAFLEKCGRFAVVTPPVVSLMLAVSDKAAAQLATSPGKITTATIATTNTAATTNTLTNTQSVTIVTTTTGGSSITTTTAITNTVTDTKNITVTSTLTSTVTPVPPLTELHAPSKHADLAMIIDSLGIRKVT